MDPTPTLYGLEKCTTCRKARAWLEAAGIQYRFIDYREQPVAPETLLRWSRELTWPRLVNRGSMTWRGLPEARKDPGTDADWLALVAEYPALVRRPVTETAGAVVTGFSEPRYQALFGR